MPGRLSESALAVVFVVLAGCVAHPQAFPEAELAPAALGAASHSWAERALPFGPGHDHRDPAAHADRSTANFEVLGWDPLVTGYHGRTSGGYFCGQAVDAGTRRLAFVPSFTNDVALVVADVTNVSAPVKVGELVLPRTHVYDAAASPDGRWVVLGTDPTDLGPDRSLLGVAPYWLDACTGERRAAGALDALPLASATVLVDVSDPANPQVVDYSPAPVLGPHSVFVTRQDGRLLVLSSITNLAHHGSYFELLEIEETAAGGRLVPLSVMRPQGRTAFVNGHVDGWIHPHPVTGRTLAYLADWDGGLAVYDVTEPRAPLQIGRWDDFAVAGRDDYGYIHGALPVDGLWDGRHYTIVGQEVGGPQRNAPTGSIYVLDTTDPARPAYVARWTLPVAVEWQESAQFSTHYFRLVDRTLFVAMYHGGVWAVDLSNPAAPRSVGAFLPANVSPSPPGHLAGDFGDWAPTVLDLDPMSDGTLVVFDGGSGVYTVRFDAASPAAAVHEWFRS